MEEKGIREEKMKIEEVKKAPGSIIGKTRIDIVELLKDSDDAYSVKGVADELGRSINSVRNCLVGLVENEKVTRKRIGKKHFYWIEEETV